MRYLFFQFLVVIGFTSFAQDDPMEHLIDSLADELGIRELKMDVRSQNAVSDTTMWLETRFYDGRGNIIETISPHRRGFTRRVFGFDSLDRRILYRSYDIEDTTAFHSETRWIYTDSSTYSTEEYYEGKLVRKVVNEARYAQDTFWIVENKYNYQFDYYDRRMIRDRSLGDSLRITEYVDYDDSMKLSDIEAYYHLKRPLDTGYLIMAGQYIIKSDEWDQFYASDSLMRDYYMHPEKYLQLQLDGAYEYEYSEDPFTYKIYNHENQLLQNDRGFFKTTFMYNEKGQLVKSVSWGEDWKKRYHIIETGNTVYEYYKNGLPSKVTSINIERGTTRSFLYSYKFE